MRGVLAGLIAALAASAALAARPVEEPASPLRRPPPAYPHACLPAVGETKGPQIVTVAFAIAEDGRTENISVISSTDECYEEAALIAVAGWTYTPLTVDGAPRQQPSMQSNITFVMENVPEIRDFDARPIKRVPPYYPRECESGAATEESVHLEYDVSEGGATENIRIVESTNSCFDDAAKGSVAKWRFRPKTESGEAVLRAGVQTIITFELVNGGRGPQDGVGRELKKALKAHREESDPVKALEVLEALQKKSGVSFDGKELAVFHQLRGMARIAVEDYAGALDDLRICQRLGLSGESSEAIASSIIKLEAIVAGNAAAAPDQVQ